MLHCFVSHICCNICCVHVLNDLPSRFMDIFNQPNVPKLFLWVFSQEYIQIHFCCSVLNSPVVEVPLKSTQNDGKTTYTGSDQFVSLNYVPSLRC